MLPGADCELLGAPRVGGTWEFRGNAFFICRAVKPHVDRLTFGVPPFWEESAQSRFQPIVNMYCTNWKMEAQRSGGLLHPGGGLVSLLLDPWACKCKQIDHMYTPPLPRIVPLSLFPSLPFSLSSHVSPFRGGDPTTYARLPLLSNLLFSPHYCVRHSFLGQ